MKLNSVEILTPKQFAVDEKKQSKIDYTSSGRRVEDIRAIKFNYKLMYVGIRWLELQPFINAYRAGVPVEFNYWDEGSEQSVMVAVASLPRGIYTEVLDVSYNLTITLEEV